MLCISMYVTMVIEVCLCYVGGGEMYIEIGRDY